MKPMFDLSNDSLRESFERRSREAALISYMNNASFRDIAAYYSCFPNKAEKIMASTGPLFWESILTEHKIASAKQPNIGLPYKTQITEAIYPIDRNFNLILHLLFIARTIISNTGFSRDDLSFFSNLFLTGIENKELREAWEIIIYILEVPGEKLVRFNKLIEDFAKGFEMMNSAELELEHGLTTNSDTDLQEGKDTVQKDW